MDKVLKESLKRFLAENNRARIENDGCAVWKAVLTNIPAFEGKHPRICVVFSRYQGNQVNKTILSDILNSGVEQVMGLVLAIPSYWLNVDPYLTQCYLEFYIDEFVNEHYKQGSGGGATECPCPPPAKPKPPHGHRPQPPAPQPLPPGFTPAGTPTPPPMYFPQQPQQPPMSPPRPGGIPSDFNKV